MKLRAILNGITALLAIGMFYTFSVCMVQDVTEDEISSKYFYEEMKSAEESNKDETVTEKKKETETTRSEKEEKSEKSAFALPGGIVVPKAAPDAEVLSMLDVSDEDEEDDENITDDEYDENSKVYSGYSDDELENILQEDDDVDEYFNATATVSDGSSRNSSKKSVSSGNIDADAINNKKVSSNGKTTKKQSRREEAVHTVTYEVPASNNSVYVDEALIASLDSGCGETLTARVHGEVSDFDAYDLVCMIVANEMSPSFGMEALKAQAVAAYSYVKYHNDRGLTASVLVKEDVPDEIKYAVASVWGKCCYYNGQTAQTVYTASTSGYTASAVNVWGGDPVPYLSCRECTYDATSDPNYGVEKIYTENEMRNKLQGYFGITLSDNPNSWLQVTDYVDGNYVNTVNIDGQTEISGAKLREKVLGYGIRSAAFTVYYSDGEFVFTTYGYGHGVGMSQNGANALASQGYDYKQILEYYYEGITVE